MSGTAHGRGTELAVPMTMLLRRWAAAIPLLASADVICPFTRMMPGARLNYAWITKERSDEP
jgi:hypothetical protein